MYLNLLEDTNKLSYHRHTKKEIYIHCIQTHPPFMKNPVLGPIFIFLFQYALFS